MDQTLGGLSQLSIKALDVSFENTFGQSVSVSGDVAIVGSVGNNFFGVSEPSMAAVFARNKGAANAWGHVVTLTSDTAAPVDFLSNDAFGTSVSISGDTIIVGAPRDDHAGEFSGSAWVFAVDGSVPILNELTSLNTPSSRRI